jgi:hypothetical protein
MAEQHASKSGRFRRWRERWRARSERARDIERRSKQARGGDFERQKQSSGSGGYGGPGMPGGI